MSKLISLALLGIQIERMLPSHFKFISLTLLLAIVNGGGTEVSAFQEDAGDPLYLTPLLKAGEIEEARNAALATHFAPEISYSGFITVDEEFGANTFFWYFPSQLEDNGDIPVVLWLEGGLGLSDVRTVFSSTGPFLPISELNFTANPNSWHTKYHMIYIDNPIGAGFSHTFEEDGNVNSSAEAAQNIYSFLQQFFQMFPNLQPYPFYIFGVSYGAKFATETAHLIHNENYLGSNAFINLSGVIGDSPWIEVYTQANYANILFGAGVISKAQREEYAELEATARALIEEERWAEAAYMSNLFREDVVTKAGYNALGDLIDDGVRGRRIDMTQFIELTSTRRGMHVGSLKYERNSGLVKVLLAEDSMQSSANKLDFILKNNYKFLVLTGNTDVMTGHTGLNNLFHNSLTWDGANELVDGNRSIWLVNERVAGYSNQVGRVRMVWIRNAGHDTFATQTEWHWDAVQKFIDE